MTYKADELNEYAELYRKAADIIEETLRIGSVRGTGTKRANAALYRIHGYLVDEMFGDRSVAEVSRLLGRMRKEVDE